MVMTKKMAIAIFDSGAGLGRALGISRAAISQWPEMLDQKQTDMVVGAAMRLGKPVPPEAFAPQPDQVAA